MSTRRPAVRAVPAAALLLCAAAVCMADGTGTLVPSLPSNYTPSLNESEGGLWMASQAAEAQIAASPRRVVDPALDAYLHDILCRLAPDYCAKVRVYVMRVPYFNASMMPNGAMQVWTGLLLRVRDEAELAAVLGHELGHYLRRHSYEGLKDAELKSNLLTLLTLGLGGAAAAGGIAPAVAQSASSGAQLAAIGSMYAFSRDNEREADAFGLQMLANAGYDPLAAGALWQNLLTEEKAGGDDRRSAGFFFATHPAPADRLDALRAQAARMHATQTIDTAAAHSAYFANVGKHLPDYFDDELHLNQIGRSEHLFKQLLNSGFAPGLVNYALGEVERMRDTGKRSNAALDYYQASLRFDDAPPVAYRAIGMWMLKARRLDEARSAFQNYLDRAPAASDREMIQYYLAQCGGEGR